MPDTKLVCPTCGNDQFEIYQGTHPGAYAYFCAACGGNGAVVPEADDA